MDVGGKLLMDNSPLRRQVSHIKTATGLGWDIIEQDYVLSWVLFGISKIEKLKSTLVFKGGNSPKEMLLWKLPLLSRS